MTSFRLSLLGALAFAGLVCAQPARAQNNLDYCNRYANESIASNVEGKTKTSCPYYRSVKMDRDIYFNWCMSNPRSKVETSRETQSSRLDGCMSSFPTRGGASAGAPRPLPGQHVLQWIEVAGEWASPAMQSNEPVCVARGERCKCNNVCGARVPLNRELTWHKDGCNRDPITIRCVKASSVAPASRAAPVSAGAPGGGQGCPAPGSIRSTPDTRHPVNMTFGNLTNTTLTIYWLDHNGQRKKYRTLRPKENYSQQTFKDHAWIAVDPSGRCRGGLYRVTGAVMYLFQ